MGTKPVPTFTLDYIALRVFVTAVRISGTTFLLTVGSLSWSQNVYP
jgi:hypothetical protein